MLRALIIDDENNARFLLAELIKRNFADRVTVVGEANDVDTGLVAIEKFQPDLVFLDIKMQKGTGFDLLEALKTVDFEVVFVTAYDNFAIKAFDFAAFGYLLKPVKSSDLGNVITRLEKQARRLKEGTDQRIKVLIDNYGDESGKLKRIVISNMEGFKVVDITDIVRLEASSNYTNFVLTRDRKIMVSRTLGEYEELLQAHGFFRIHQSHIVNLRHVEAYLKTDGGQVKMTDGHLLTISRNKKASFMRRFF
jgi:two-component system, LytTR family, response regulator